MEKKWKFRLQPKLLLGLVIMAVVLAFSIISTISWLFGILIEEYYSQVTFAQASIASDTIDGDRIKSYYHDGQCGEKDDYYGEISGYLNNVKARMGLKYFCVVVPEENGMVYIWDTGIEDNDAICDLGERTLCADDVCEAMHNAFAVNVERTVLITDNISSAYVAVVDSDNNPVALSIVGISMERVKEHITKFMILTLGVTVVVLLFSTIAYYIYIRKTLIRPLSTLHHAVIGLVSDNMEHLDEFKVNIKTRDEVRDLADSFQHMVHELNDYIHNLSRVTAERERIGAELDVATHIQKSMLPCTFPAFPGHKEIDIYATMDPAKEVGGDFYDFFMVDGRHLAIVMADVSGKGVPAALFMVIGKTLIKDHTAAETDLGDVFSEVNDLLCESNSEGLFITAFEGVLDLVSGEFNYVNAGHEMPFICHSGESYSVHKIKPGFVLAGMEGMMYKAGSLTLSPGDKVFQYTDGVTEATNSQNELYGMERLEKVLNANKYKSPAELLPAVKADIDFFVGEAPQFDDITMLCLEYKSRMEGQYARADH